MSASTTAASDWTLERLESLKGARRVAVVIPAHNEESTVGDVVRGIVVDLGGFIDELIVMDSLSTDRTAQVASDAGARVFSVEEVRPDLGVFAGKGEALWKSLFVTSSDVMAFIDADLTEWGTHFVRGVVGPILGGDSVILCRGFYDRVLEANGVISLEGGRVTELVARPWLSLFRTELTDVVQPLAGEWAIRRSAFEELSIPKGYGVELSTLLDVHGRYGRDAIAQVDLGRRAHTHQHVHDLSAMALEILATADRRRETAAPETSPEGYSSDVELKHMGLDRTWSTRRVHVDERPPMADIALLEP